MQRAWILYGFHVAALAFGLGGILIALPNPHLWADSEYGTRVFEFGMNYGGASHIVFGAMAMLALGGATIGWRKTLIFFAVAFPISLSSELIGTTTGLPFGEYAYTSGLGTKVLGKVPFTIPLSWFYLGLASYFLGLTLARRFAPRHASIAGVLTGVYLLVVWDLVLDPAMAHEDLPVKFWQWFDTGPYFGMPVINFVGWALTGLIFTAAARMLWKENPPQVDTPVVLPFMIYLANMVFAMALSLSVDLWQPVVIAGVLGLIPAALALGSGVGMSRTSSAGGSIGKTIVAKGAGLLIRRRGGVTVEHAARIPASGPAILVSRHYHHLWDGCAIVASTARNIHIVAGLDWIRNKPTRALMEMACGSAGWPVILREDALNRPGAESAYSAREARQYLLKGIRQSTELLRNGELLVMFPEAYPNIDPGYTPKSNEQETLPFRAGFARIARIAERGTGQRIPIIPVGLGYQDDPHGQITVRYGEPVFLDQFDSEDAVVREVERSVLTLSGLARQPAGVSSQPVVAS